MEKKVKRRRKKIKIGYVLAFAALFIILIIGIKLMLPNSKSKYGNRLEGIEKISFDNSAKSKIVKKINSNDKANGAKVEVQGRIINIIFNVKKDVSKDDAKAIASDSLGQIKDNVKKYYDIQYMITKKDEEGTKKKETNEDGKEVEVTVTVFPIMGYKNSKSDKIVW